MASRTRPLDIIRIKNAVFYAYHGVLSDEQHLGGKFEVDVELHCDLRKGAVTDHLKDTVDYERVYDCVKTSVMERKHFLLESLGQAIINGLFRNFRQVKAVTVRVRKPNAPVKGVIDTVEVEMVRRRGA
jgi:7,8-dihydroneopterin aldolase/epimerase/oxygenase